ncbi:MAG: hypothetical protein II836_05185 [Clostridia bacterium]|nr:hypothetical protein [Clostridia bacterium]
MAKPTKEQLVWRDLELGVLIHYCMEIYRPELKGDWYKTKRVRTEIAPETLDPKSSTRPSGCGARRPWGRNTRCWWRITARAFRSGTRR